MRTINKKTGMVLPLSLLAIIAVLGLVTTLGSLNQGVKSQIYRTNNHQLSFLIAYSAFSRVCAKIHSFSWASRPFLTEPYAETMVPFQGGHYDLLAEDTAGKKHQADIYIRTHLAGISRMYFWRIRVNEDLLDISNSIIVEMYETAQAEDFPVIGGPRTIAGKVEDMLAKRATNQKKSDQLASEITGSNNPASIIEQLNGRPPEDFEQDWPVPQSETEMTNKTQVSPPEIDPPAIAEEPGAPGPDPLRVVEAVNDSMTGNRIDSLSQQLALSADQLVVNTNNGWDQIDANGVAGIPAAQDYWAAASDAKESSYDTLDTLVSESKSGIAEAPTPAAREAMEEMVSQTVAAAMTKIATSIERGFNHLVVGGDQYLNSLTTVEAVEALLVDWRTAEDITVSDVAKLSSLSSSTGGYSKPAEVAQAMAEAIDSVKANLEVIKAAVVSAEARLAELKALQAASAEEIPEETVDEETPQP